MLGEYMEYDAQRYGHSFGFRPLYERSPHRIHRCTKIAREGEKQFFRQRCRHEGSPVPLLKDRTEFLQIRADTRSQVPQVHRNRLSKYANTSISLDGLRLQAEAIEEWRGFSITSIHKRSLRRLRVHSKL
jgi:hypothetical protein